MPNITAERLQLLRGKTPQKNIADLVGVGQTTYSNWENGVNFPPSDAIAKLARHWKVSADYLVGLSDHREPLPRDAWVVDLDFVDAARAGKLNTSILGDQGAFAIPARPCIMSSVEVQKLERELAHILKGKRGSR